MERIPRKKKQQLKRMWKHRYGIDWLRCENIIVEYKWFFKNPLKYNMNKSIYDIRGNKY